MRSASPRRAAPKRALPPQPRRMRRGELSSASVFAWTTIGAFIPGVGLIRGGRRVIGGLILGVTILFWVAVGLTVYFDLERVISVAVSPLMLKSLSIGLIGLAVVWVVIIGSSHLALRSPNASRNERAAGALLVCFLSFLVAAPLFVGARYASASQSLINTVFKKESDTRSQTRPDDVSAQDKSPFADKDRLNILLLGGDNSRHRNPKYGIRTDTIMLASINPKTGDTVLIQLPRNMARAPFPEGTPLHDAYPDGFYDGNDADNASYFLNAVWNDVPGEHPELFENTDYPGADALKITVGEAVGLKVDYFLLVSIDGIVELIDAMGGINLNVNSKIPMGGNSEGLKPYGYLTPGPDQHLNGTQAMWYARARLGSSDFARMKRQSCVVKAVIDQADPGTMLTRYEAIAHSAKDIVITDIPQELLPAIVNLSLVVKGSKVDRVLFQHRVAGYDTTDPDFRMMADRVAKAIENQDVSHSSPSPTALHDSTSTATSTTKAPANDRGASKESSAKETPTAPNSPATDLVDECAYHPKD